RNVNHRRGANATAYYMTNLLLPAAGRAPGRDRGRARPPLPQGRCAGALRRLLVLAGGSVLRAGALRLLAGRQEGQAADRLRFAVCGRRLPGRGRSVRRQYRRPDDIVGANRQAQRALRLVTRRVADWREVWALFPGDVAYVWHGSVHVSEVCARVELRDASCCASSTNNGVASVRRDISRSRFPDNRSQDTSGEC